MKTYFVNIFRYDLWANGRVSKSLKEQNVKEQPILKLFSHIILAEKIWLMRIKDLDYKSINFWNTLTIDRCEKLIPEINADYRSFINSSTEEELNKKFEYQNSKGITYKNSIAETLTHVVFHSAYHRGQIAKEIRKMGKEPVVTDYIAFIRKS